MSAAPFGDLSHPMQQRLLQSDFLEFMQNAGRSGFRLAAELPAALSTSRGSASPSLGVEDKPCSLPTHTHKVTAAEANNAASASCDEQHLCVICMENFKEDDLLRT